MKIITYNVNGIRSALSKDLAGWLREENPDVLCLQEIKAQEDQIPQNLFESLGYKQFYFPAKKKGYSGVAILTKIQPDNVVYGMNIPRYDDEGRFVMIDIGDISIASVYHPSGTSGDERQDFKMKWLDDFLLYANDLKTKRKKLILCGDFNICHKPIDIHDPVRNAKNSGFLPEEREWLSRFLESGFIDTFRYFHDGPDQYTWWSYRFNARKNNKGWRIDYCMVNSEAEDMLKSAAILPDVKHSDHCPVLLEIHNGTKDF